MNTMQVAESLKESANKNKAFNAVVHDFALRKRARNIITIQALKQRMKEERFTFSDSEYAETLRILARMGLGTIELDSRGRVKALKDIKVKLQSIGQIACRADGQLNKFRARNKFKPLPQYTQPHNEIKLSSLSTLVSITLEVRGKPVTVSLPKDLSNEEIAEIISRLT